MTNNNQVANQEVNSMMVIDGLKLDRVSESMKKIQEFQAIMQSQLIEGIDHGAAFPGSTKTSLLKPGAEKILMLLGLTSEYEIIEKIQNYDDGFFAYTIRCLLTKGGQVITHGLGHCNSREKKYDGDKQDKYMLGNTCLKMAKKRAQVDAALTVGSLSNIFTQDLEDMVQFNQAERTQTLNSGEAHDVKVNFGKYGKNGGKTLGEIVEVDRGYVEWLRDNARDDYMKKAATIVLSGEKKQPDKSPKQETNNVSQAAKETGIKHHPENYPQNVDLETGEIQDDLPWENEGNEDLPF